MRTTLTLEDDVAKALEAEVRRTGDSFKETVNRLLRRGLASQHAGGKREPFSISARELGSRAGLNYDNVADLLEYAEGPENR